jgi:riboflavin kinase/FMN adenylyltransferase
MDVAVGVDGLDPRHGRLFVVVGVFDGLHRGHRYLLTRLRRAAAARAARPAVITFDAHPDEVVVGAAPPLLCDPDERLARLAADGVEVTVVQHFDAALRMTEFDEFVARIQARTDLAGLLMTPDAAFGHDRRGTATALTELGEQTGFDVVVVPPLEVDGRPVRSSTIREAIAAGDLPTARRLMGRRVAVSGDLDGSTVRFPVPVALPPAGDYRAALEPAWTPEGPVAPARRATVRVEADRLILPPESAPDGAARARVAFVRRLPEHARPAILGRSQK